MQRRQLSAQMRQCSCMEACLWHSSAHSRQAAAQTLSMRRIISSVEPVRRVEDAAGDVVSVGAIEI